MKELDVTIAFSSGRNYDEKDPIKQMEADAGNRMLGVWLAPEWEQQHENSLQ